MYALVDPPVSEPLPLGEIKAALRVDHDADDALILDMTRTARTFLERRLDRAFLPQTWRMTCEGVPRRVRLRPGPVTGVLSAASVASDGTRTPLAPDAFRLTAARGAVVEIAGSYDPGHDLEIVFRAGHEDADAIPADLLRALFLLTAHYYEEREVFAQRRYVALPLGVSALIEAHREVAL